MRHINFQFRNTFTKKYTLLTMKNCRTFHASNVNVLRITRLEKNYVILIYIYIYIYIYMYIYIYIYIIYI